MHAFRCSRRCTLSWERVLLPALVVGLLSLFVLSGCSLPWQRATVSSGPGPRPSAQQVLSVMQKNFRTVTSFHLSMKTENLGNTGASQLLIRAADGDVLLPDKIRAQANVLLSGQAVTVNLISVGPSQFITDPITGQWRVVKGMFDPRILTNPDTGIMSLAGKVQHVSGPIADTVNGVSCWRVTGLLPASDLAFFTGGGVPAGTLLQTSICAGQSDGLPYQISITGQAAVGDTARTTRTFLLSKYNENISIVAPQV
jgi:hypothetical protein